MGATGLVYEPLFQFNLANPATAPYPWLATAFTLGRRRQVDHLHDPPGREVERRPAVHRRRRGIHVQVRAQEYANSKTDNINFGGLPVTSVSHVG